MEIRDLLPETELLSQLAEEAAELAQAALKLRRALDGTNPTPKSVSECREALREEYTDVVHVGIVLNLVVNEKQVRLKDKRWRTRLEERGQKADDRRAETHGYWRYRGETIGVRCSACGKWAVDSGLFCPNCGAIMDGGVRLD